MKKIKSLQRPTRLGHAFGDQLLIEFARVARQNLRQNDLIIRYGGDEFVLVLNHLPRNQSGSEEVERILKRIQVQYAAIHIDLVLGFSYGISMLENGLEQTLAAADKRMYRMKEQKKDRGEL